MGDTPISLRELMCRAARKMTRNPRRDGILPL